MRVRTNREAEDATSLGASAERVAFGAASEPVDGTDGCGEATLLCTDSVATGFDGATGAVAFVSCAWSADAPGAVKSTPSNNVELSVAMPAP